MHAFALYSPEFLTLLSSFKTIILIYIYFFIYVDINAVLSQLFNWIVKDILLW